MGTTRIQAGVIITYRLRPSDLPTNPQRLWYGIVKDVYTRACRVCLTEPGYEGLDEMIFLSRLWASKEGQDMNHSQDDINQPQEALPALRKKKTVFFAVRIF